MPADFNSRAREELYFSKDTRERRVHRRVARVRKRGGLLYIDQKDARKLPGSQCLSFGPGEAGGLDRRNFLLARHRATGNPETLITMYCTSPRPRILSRYYYVPLYLHVAAEGRHTHTHTHSQTDTLTQLSQASADLAGSTAATRGAQLGGVGGRKRPELHAESSCRREVVETSIL